MSKYLVSANETSYYLRKEVEAKDAVEAEEKYLQMIEEGNVEVVDSDMFDVKVEEVRPTKRFQVIQTIWREYQIEADTREEAKRKYEECDDLAQYFVGDKTAEADIVIDEIK